MPTQNRSARSKNIEKGIWERLKMKVPRITLQWAELKLQNGCKNLAIVHGRVRDDVEKNDWKQQQQIEEKKCMKNNNKMKNKMNEK